MPCIGGPSWEQIHEEQKMEDRKRRKQERMEALLCSACRILDRLGYDFDENPELSNWWDEHKKEDEAKALAASREAFQRQLAMDTAKKPVTELTQDDIKLLKKHGYFK